MASNPSARVAVAATANISELYREIFQRSIDGIAIIDANGYYVEQNPAHEILTGYTDADLRGQTPAIHLGNEGFSTVAMGLQRDGLFRGVLESRGKSGARKKIDLAAFPVRETDGTPVYFVGIKRDITEHVRLAEERDARLRELESLYGLTRALNRAHEPHEIYNAAIEALISAVGADRASVLVYDGDGLMHFKAWHGLSDEYMQAVDGHSPWQRSEQNATTIPISDVFTEISLRSYLPVLMKEGIRGLAFIPIAYEQQLLGKFMVYYNQPHEFTPEEIRMAEALAAQIAVVIQRGQSEEALRRSEKLAAAGKLAATVAHEINNPLEGIMNLAFLLKQQVAGNEVATRYLNDMENELKRVSLITRRTLAFYRDTEPPGRIQVGAIIEEVVQLFRPKLSSVAVELRCSVNGETLVHGSAGELRQVFLNLLSNAIEAVRTDGTIEVEVRREPQQVIITVSDSGPGIDATKAHLIFEPFFTTKKETGTGLGLPLSREIIKRHGGTLEASNAKNGGAVLTICLPSA